MCGIVAIAGRVDPALLKTMTHSLRHRGPDGEGTWISANGQLALGHRRLSIIDLSNEASQPMHDETSGYSISFNGEIYNYRQLRSELESRGHRFRSQSDTEVLLHHFVEFGLDGLRKIRGMFAFAIVHEATGRMWCARDRFGIKPLYFSENTERIVVASEVRTLLADPTTKRDINHDAVFFTVKHLWTPAPLTLLSSIKKLEPGHALVIEGGRIVSKVHYWDVAAGVVPTIRRPEEEVVETIRELLRAAVDRQMVSDVPVGSFLSGGLDSSSLVCSASHAENFTRTYCAQVDSNEMAKEGFAPDLPYARLAAEAAEVPLSEVHWDGNIDSILVDLVRQSDELHADPASWLTYLISRQARADGVKVLLSGTGGDDVFTGYRRHILLRWNKLLATIPQFAAVSAQRAFGIFGSRNPRSIRIQRALDEVGRTPESQVDSLFSWIDDSSIPVTQSKGQTSPISQTFTSTNTDADFMQRVLRVEQLHFLSDHNLGYIDTHSMAAGVEVRVPFLDDDLVDYVASIPQEQLMSHFRPKVLFEHAMKSVVPPPIINRPKTGFGSAIRLQVRSRESQLVQELLSESLIKSRGLFNAETVAHLSEKNQRGEIDASYPLLAVAMIEQYLQEHIDK